MLLTDVPGKTSDSKKTSANVRYHYIYPSTSILEGVVTEPGASSQLNLQLTLKAKIKEFKDQNVASTRIILNYRNYNIQVN